MINIRELQAPLKAQYKEHPETALITLHAEAVLGEQVTARIERRNLVAGLHPATGGTGAEACSGDMLLEALAACAGVTMNAVASAMGIVLKNATVRAEGVIDFRGTLGLTKEVQVGFKEIRMKFLLDTDADSNQVASLIKLTERYCVVFQTLKNPPEIIVEMA